MRLKRVTVSTSAFDFINQTATTAINELSKKDNLDACDIKAIEALLVLCNLKASDFKAE